MAVSMYIGGACDFTFVGPKDKIPELEREAYDRNPEFRERIDSGVIEWMRGFNTYLENCRKGIEQVRCQVFENCLTIGSAGVPDIHPSEKDHIVYLAAIAGYLQFVGKELQQRHAFFKGLEDKVDGWALGMLRSTTDTFFEVANLHHQLTDSLDLEKLPDGHYKRK